LLAYLNLALLVPSASTAPSRNQKPIRREIVAIFALIPQDLHGCGKNALIRQLSGFFVWAGLGRNALPGTTVESAG